MIFISSSYRVIYIYIYKQFVSHIYIIIHVHSAFSLVASCVLLKYTCTDGVN